MRDYESEWRAIALRVARLLVTNDKEAITELNGFLRHNPPSHYEREALAYRAHAKENLGDLSGAIEDLRRSYQLSEAGTYRRYTLELCLGALSAEAGDHDHARVYLLAALRTARDGENISGGAALRRFVEETGGRIDGADRTLCEEVVRRSWSVLNQSGDPDFSDLADAAERLIALGGSKQNRQE